MDRRAALSLAAVVGLSAGAASLVYVLRNKEKVKYSLRCLVEGEPYEVRVARQTLGNAAKVVLETREEVETIRQRCGINTSTLAVHVIDTFKADQEIKAAKKCNIALEHLLSREIDAVQALRQDRKHMIAVIQKLHDDIDELVKQLEAHRATLESSSD